MPAKIRVAAVDFSHGHMYGLLSLLKQSPDAEFVGAWIGNIPLSRMNQAVKAVGQDRIFESREQLYRKARPQAVLCCSPNAQHAEDVQEFARRGLHVLIEKPMAATLGQADEMVAAAEKAGIRLLINWPSMWSGCVHKARQLLQDGAIGRIVRAHFRGGHMGPGSEEWFWRKETGGGILLDYCSYGATFLRYALGERARSVLAWEWKARPDREVADNAVLVAQYPSTLAVIEGSWTLNGRDPLLGVVFNGMEGILQTDFYGDGPVRILTTSKPEGILVPPEPRPAGQRNPIEYFLHLIRKEAEAQAWCDPRLCRDAQETLQAGIDSVLTGQRVELVKN
ncbi:MAG: Gfo/Idh/MocA family oxidoreductase [Planctomycetes bacterium]|nr:Gfo/Idh/MocA family oxidoreductase [Planctomycetota bacterium]